MLKKILLGGFFASSMFILYSISNIAGIRKIEDTDFITMNKNYLQVDMAKISVDNYKKYEDLEAVNYILPGNSEVIFKVKFNEYYQTAKLSLNLTGSLTDVNTISKEQITLGRMPENEYEIVVDKMVIDKMLNDSSRIGKHVGIKGENDLLNKKVSVSNMKDFTIVGFIDEKSPSIYTKKEVFINLLNNKGDTEGNGTFYYTDTFVGEIQEESTEGKVVDYNLYLDDITLTKGKMPDADYEVIVNKENESTMKLNKKIKTKVNGTELTVVGYYESKTNSKNFLVSPNTVKYEVISKSDGIVVYPKDEMSAIQKLKYEENLNIFNRYQKDKETYIQNRKESVTSSIIFAGIILRNITNRNISNDEIIIPFKNKRNRSISCNRSKKSRHRKNVPRRNFSNNNLCWNSRNYTYDIYTKNNHKSTIRCKKLCNRWRNNWTCDTSNIWFQHSSWTNAII